VFSIRRIFAREFEEFLRSIGSKAEERCEKFAALPKQPGLQQLFCAAQASRGEIRDHFRWDPGVPVGLDRLCVPGDQLGEQMPRKPREPNGLTPRDDRRQQSLSFGSDQDKPKGVRRLFEYLEKGVGCLRRQTLGAIDDDDLIATLIRPVERQLLYLANGCYLDDAIFRFDEADIRVSLGGDHATIAAALTSDGERAVLSIATVEDSSQCVGAEKLSYALGPLEEESMVHSIAGDRSLQHTFDAVLSSDFLPVDHAGLRSGAQSRLVLAIVKRTYLRKAT
jgi:hypothetical protein